MIKELIDKIHKYAESIGDWLLMDEYVNRYHKDLGIENAIICQKLLLIISEVTEAMEALRKDKFCTKKSLDYMEEIKWSRSHYRTNIKGTLEEELADTAIRLFDLCGYLGVDLEKHIELKLEYLEACKTAKFTINEKLF